MVTKNQHGTPHVAAPVEGDQHGLSNSSAQGGVQLKPVKKRELQLGSDLVKPNGDLGIL